MKTARGHVSPDFASPWVEPRNYDYSRQKRVWGSEEQENFSIPLLRLWLEGTKEFQLGKPKGK